MRTTDPPPTAASVRPTFVATPRPERPNVDRCSARNAEATDAADAPWRALDGRANAWPGVVLTKCTAPLAPRATQTWSARSAPSARASAADGCDAAPWCAGGAAAASTADNGAATAAASKTDSGAARRGIRTGLLGKRAHTPGALHRGCHRIPNR